MSTGLRDANMRRGHAYDQPSVFRASDAKLFEIQHRPTTFPTGNTQTEKWKALSRKFKPTENSIQGKITSAFRKVA